MIEVRGRITATFDVTLEVDEESECAILDALFPNGFEGEVGDINWDNATITPILEEGNEYE